LTDKLGLAAMAAAAAVVLAPALMTLLILSKVGQEELAVEAAAAESINLE
jgi:hypothetical protein